MLCMPLLTVNKGTAVENLTPPVCFYVFYYESLAIINAANIPNYDTTQTIV